MFVILIKNMWEKNISKLIIFSCFPPRFSPGRPGPDLGRGRRRPPPRDILSSGQPRFYGPRPGPGSSRGRRTPRWRGSWWCSPPGSSPTWAPPPRFSSQAAPRLRGSEWWRSPTRAWCLLILLVLLGSLLCPSPGWSLYKTGWVIWSVITSTTVDKGGWLFLLPSQFLTCPELWRET